MSKTVAISTGPETHLDHLAPLCHLMNIPLIVTDRAHLDLCRTFYPMIEAEYHPLHSLTLDVLAQLDTIVTCGKFWAMELKPLLKLFHQKEVRFLFAPHGHSDKEDLLAKPTWQDLELSYSPKKGAAAIGNLRHQFYKEHQAHFDALAAPYFASTQQTVLYAPTWATRASPTSFFNRFDEVLETLGEEYNLLIKLHPLLEENDPALFHKILQKDAQFIQDFPPIYPLLEKTDYYLGDYSSIGYDFLHYDRPLFFLETAGALSACGELFSGALHEQPALSDARSALYKKTFPAADSLNTLSNLQNTTHSLSLEHE